jgi:hypothetical protein
MRSRLMVMMVLVPLMLGAVAAAPAPTPSTAPVPATSIAPAPTSTAAPAPTASTAHAPTATAAPASAATGTPAAMPVSTTPNTRPGAPGAGMAALALVPKEAVAFINIPNLRRLEDDLKRFNKETGFEIGKGVHPALDLIARRTGIQDGIDLDGCAAVGFLDPKKFRDRYTMYVLPVADWDALLKSTGGEEMTPDVFALTGAAGPRFVARRGAYALVTSSIRTMDAVTAADVKGIIESLRPETVARASGESPTIYVDIKKIKDIYEREIAQWFRAATGQVYAEPEAVPYADMMVTYMLGIADFVDQLEGAEAALHFEPDGLAVDLSVRFVPGASIAEFLSGESPGTTVLPAVTDRPLSSGVTLRVDPAKRTDLAMRAATFFLEEAPRPQPLPDALKKQVTTAVKTFTDSLGEHMVLLSAPAAPGMGLAADVSIFDVKDPAEFRKGVTLLAAASESLADQLDLYLRFEASPETSEVAGVPVVTYVPRLRFGIPARHVAFRERLRVQYGPDGLTYRVAVVGNQAVVSVGSDLTLFRQAIERLKAGKELPSAPAVERLARHVPQTQNVFMAMSLPEYFGMALLRGGTAADRVGTIDPGQEVVGLGLRADKGQAVVTSWWPHEQLRLARELMNRAAPELTQVPESLFEPTSEGPPKFPGVPGVAPTGTGPAKTPSGTVPAVTPSGTAPATTPTGTTPAKLPPWGGSVPEKTPTGTTPAKTPSGSTGPSMTPAGSAPSKLPPWGGIVPEKTSTGTTP